ncbi:MAG: hypothetical protein QM759_16845 [Terricaulis sp.]
MKRYGIAFHSLSTGAGVEYASTDTPAEALQKAREANKNGLRDVKIFDKQTQEAFNADGFAAKYKL